VARARQQPDSPAPPRFTLRGFQIVVSTFLATGIVVADILRDSWNPAGLAFAGACLGVIASDWLGRALLARLEK